MCVCVVSLSFFHLRLSFHPAVHWIHLSISNSSFPHCEARAADANKEMWKRSVEALCATKQIDRHCNLSFLVLARYVYSLGMRPTSCHAIHCLLQWTRSESGIQDFQVWQASRLYIQVYVNSRVISIPVPPLCQPPNHLWCGSDTWVHIKDMKQGVASQVPMWQL